LIKSGDVLDRDVGEPIMGEYCSVEGAMTPLRKYCGDPFPRGPLGRVEDVELVVDLHIMVG
jgi:hypothetical protein